MSENISHNKVDDDRIIEIKDDCVTVFKIQTIDGAEKWTKEISLSIEHFIEILEEHKKIVQMPLLPRGTKLYVKNRDKEIIVVEQPPQVRTLLWSSQNRSGTLRDSGDSAQRVTVALPYVIFVFGVLKNELVARYDELPRCFYRTAPLQSLDDTLYHTNLQNVYYPTHWLCAPRIATHQNDNLTIKITKWIDSVWNSVFTDDMRGGPDIENSAIADDDYHLACDRVNDTRIASLDEWIEATREDPLFILDVPWEQSRYTVRSIVENALYMRLGEDHVAQIENITSTSLLIDIIYQLQEIGSVE